MSDEFYRRRVAYHEAGHAVAFIRLGHGCDGVSIVPGEDHLGITGGGDYGDVLEAERTRIVCGCAGFAADMELGSNEESARRGASADFERAQRTIELIGEGTLESWIAHARAFVREPQNWAAIDLIARELLEWDRIDGQVLECLVDIADGLTTREAFENSAVGLSRRR